MATPKYSPESIRLARRVEAHAWRNLRRKRRGWRRHCPHSDLSPIYGDAVNRAGGYRLWCRECRTLIDGPASLAAMRRREVTGEDPWTPEQRDAVERIHQTAARIQSRGRFRWWNS